MITFIRKPKAALSLYVVLLQIELFIIRTLSDLTPETSNWVEKASQILSFQIPSNNYYGPGSAVLLAPFVLLGTSTYFANFFYFAAGSTAYWLICSNIPSQVGRGIALCALPANFYLIWLVDSSQDTVFEFFLLNWAVLFLLRNRIGLFAFTGFILCETRAGYWVFYLGVSIGLFARKYVKDRKISLGKLFAIYFLIVSSLFNSIYYDSPSPALEGGITAYFSYTKYHYLSLPKMDMDVFLSGPNGAFSTTNGPNIPGGSTAAEVNSIYQKEAFASALANKKETILGWMQKFDSYFFDVQKIPHLPGQYVLDQDKKVIVIGDDRLSWSLIAGNFTYMLYRSTLQVSGYIALGLLLGLVLLQKTKLMYQIKLAPLSLPFILGAIPGIVIYTETRFKIVSELLLVPLIAEVISRAMRLRVKKY
jgi:hypothetical protein